MFHGERQARSEATARARESALAALQAQARQEREIELRRRDIALHDAELSNQRLRLWIGALVALVATLAAGAAALLLQGLQAHPAPAGPQTRLRGQSQREAGSRPLPGRGGRPRRRRPDFSGGLALVDIDHFKRVDDTYGHAGGDAVRGAAHHVGPARRARRRPRHALGREEFLVAWLLPKPDAQATRGLARRLAIGSSPVALDDGRRVAVTASLGHAAFPLPPHRVALAWEPALNLVDMAMYLAEAKGRNQACGIESIDAVDAQMHRAVADDSSSARAISS